MNSRSKFRIIFTLIYLTKASLAVSAEIPSGDWEGAVTLHGELAQLAEFKVKQQNDSYSITMYYNERPYKFKRLKVRDDRLTFKLDTGFNYECQLDQDSDKGYSGNCTTSVEGEKRSIAIKMIPPDDQADSEESGSNATDSESSQISEEKKTSNNADDDNRTR